MIYVLALLWVCALAMVVLVPMLVRELTTPACDDLTVLERHRDARTVLGRVTRHSISVPASAWNYGPGPEPAGGVPHGAGTDTFAASRCNDEQTAHAPRAHAGSTPTRLSAPERRVGLLVTPRDTAPAVHGRGGIQNTAV